jgi:hypothetical protein
MKKPNLKKALLLFAILFSLNVKSQLSISCYYRETCFWNKYTEKFDACSGYNERGLFEINENQTMIVHTINNITSTYYVKTREYEEETQTLSLNVVSDVGNKYIIIFDAKNLLVKFLRNDSALVLFYVKSAF